MRVIAGAIMILAGMLGLGLGDIANATRSAGSDAKTAGGIVLTLGAVLVAWEFKDAVKQYLRIHDLATGRRREDHGSQPTPTGDKE